MLLQTKPPELHHRSRVQNNSHSAYNLPRSGFAHKSQLSFFLSAGDDIFEPPDALSRNQQHHLFELRKE